MNAAELLSLLLACAPMVHPDTAIALVTVESGGNPHAIGVVGGVLQRQPRHPDEAIATANALHRAGWNYSVGLAQINRHNFERLGLTLQSAFEPCANARAMQAVLIECFERWSSSIGSQRQLQLALSCYYSGNGATGFRHGYVQRVVAAVRPVPSTVRREGNP